MYLLGKKSVYGWAIAITGSSIWVVYAFFIQAYPILFINILLIMVDARGGMKWISPKENV